MHYRAIDLGAESGRAMLGKFESGELEISERYRFANEPVQYQGELRRDTPRLWHEMNRALESSSLPRLESIGIDTWDVDFALMGEKGNLLENPFHCRDARTEGVMDTVSARLPRKDICAITGIQFLPCHHNTAGGCENAHMAFRSDGCIGLAFAHPEADRRAAESSALGTISASAFWDAFDTNSRMGGFSRRQNAEPAKGRIIHEKSVDHRRRWICGAPLLPAFSAAGR
jgi:hypothetical protein